ncbi:PHP, C-terminal [Moorella glycerini]|uniref:Polymerase/histidinol phosphatase N-terminal domain-containing protein n=1 Tax=Neomoorella stamsii TaxID=1266720 RepID=A0A9X7J609_9FIRM|nr:MULTISPECIES: PHP domain-containing protein [Moorella]PRR77511.1 hypothetical protein MOST_02610 [Moorella stamsii]CEP68260.1 PHP, C-terminal [Moorella glycerini]
MDIQRYACDLHCHTTRSDGNDSPIELIEHAAEVGVQVVAITDHDIPPPLWEEIDGREVDLRVFAGRRGVQVVLGYEFSCDTYVDDVHILGYNLDWNHPQLIEEVARARSSKTEAYRRLCEVLTSKGLAVDFEKDVLEYVDENNEKKYRNPDEVERKHIFEAMARKGYAPSWQKAKLLVRDDPELNIKRRKIDPLAAIDLIKACGGTAVLAHPLLIDEVIHYPDGRSLTRAEYIARLILRGLDGMEACYPYSKTSYKGSWSDAQAEAYIRQEYKGKVKFFTGGSDYHADGRKGIANPRHLGEAGISLEQFVAISEYLVGR